MLEISEKMRNMLKEKNDANVYNIWLRNLKFEQQNSSLIVTSNSEFSRRMIRDKFKNQIQTIAKEIIPEDLKIIFKWEKEEKNESIKLSIEKEEIKEEIKEVEKNNFFDINPKNDLKLSSKFTFESFVVGKNSQLACAAANAVVNSLGVSYNPLFIYGKTGIGKTHLMQAIGHAVIEQDKRKKIIYLTCEEFMNLMIEAIQKNTMQKFRARFRKVDLLMIDDIQFLAKKEQTQEEFFNTFNALYLEHRQIVLTSDCQPKELTNLQERLVSRFEWGLVTDIQPPSYETRISILKKKCELSNLKVPYEILEFLAENFGDNVRQMEGALNRVYTYSKLLNSSLTLSLAKENLKDLIKIENTKRITVEDIIQKVGKFYNITILQMQGPKRLKNYAFPRQIAMYLARNYTELSLPEIGNAFGGRDHTTVLHACRKIEHQIKSDDRLKTEIDALSQELLD